MLVYNATLITTAVNTVLLCISFITSFDAQSGYFTEGLYPTAFAIFFIFQIIVSLASVLALPRHRILATPNELDVKNMTFALIGTALVLLSALRLVLNVSHASTIDTLSCLGSSAFGIYLLIIALKKSYELKIAKQISLYLTILFPVSIFLVNNSNYNRHINSVENTLTIVFLVSFLCYLICEGRRLLLGTHTIWHFPSMLLTFSTGATLSASYIAAYLSDAVHEDFRFFDMLLILLICIYILIEAKRFLTEHTAHTKEEWDIIHQPKQIEEIEVVAETDVVEETEEISSAEATVEFEPDPTDR